MHTILMLLLCLNGDVNQCTQVPVPAPKVISAEACTAAAKAAFKRVVAADKESIEAKSIVLQSFLCGYVAGLNDGRPT